MCHIDLLNFRYFPQSVDLRHHGKSGLFKSSLPGILIISGHIIIGMVAGYHHQRAKHHVFITAVLHFSDCVFQRRGFRLPFYRSYKHVFVSQGIVYLLHYCVSGFRLVAGAVPHKDKGRIFRVADGLKTCRLCRCRSYILCHCLSVRVCIQQRFGNRN